METKYHFQYKQETHGKLSQISGYEPFSKGLKNEFETAVAISDQATEVQLYNVITFCLLFIFCVLTFCVNVKAV